jgi:hypothetical protein
VRITTEKRLERLEAADGQHGVVHVVMTLYLMTRATLAAH